MTAIECDSFISDVRFNVSETDELNLFKTELPSHFFIVNTIIMINRFESVSMECQEMRFDIMRVFQIFTELPVTKTLS